MSLVGSKGVLCILCRWRRKNFPIKWKLCETIYYNLLFSVCLKLVRFSLKLQSMHHFTFALSQVINLDFRWGFGLKTETIILYTFCFYFPPLGMLARRLCSWWSINVRCPCTCHNERKRKAKITTNLEFLRTIGIVQCTVSPRWV